ncbi:MAG: MFS transporter [Microbacteriaceae bacterium]
MTAPARFPYAPLITLATANFLAVSSEFLPTGLLPDIATSLGVSESRVGLFSTAFAIAVALTAPPLALLTRGFSRKWLLVVALGVFALCNVVIWAVPVYGVILVARVLAGMAHGVFWAVSGAYAAHLVPRHQLARAVSITNGGGSLAFVLGVPIGTAVGHALGWQRGFLAMGATIVVLAVGIAVLLPAVDHRVRLATGEIALPLHRDRSIPALLAVFACIVVLAFGQNVFYTYVTPWLLGPGAFSAGVVPVLLFVYGAAGAVGLVLTGMLADRFPRGILLGQAVLSILSVAGLAVTAGATAPSLVLFVLWSIAQGGIPAVLQSRMLHAASARIRDVAAGAQTSAFNISIGGGALVGGILLDGFGVAFLPWAFVLVNAVGLVVVVLATPRAPAGHQLGHTQPIPVAGC